MPRCISEGSYYKHFKYVLIGSLQRSLMKEVFWKGNEGFLGKSEELGEGPEEEEEVRGGLRFLSAEGVGVTGTLRCEICWLWSTGQDTLSLAS